MRPINSWDVAMDNSSKTVLVLGASGGIGGEVARQLRDAGWTVKALKRGQAAAHEVRDGIHCCLLYTSPSPRDS